VVGEPSSWPLTHLLAKIPAMVEDYRKTVEAGLKVLAEPKNVSAAREMVRRLLVDGKIVLTPNEAHTAIAGRVHFRSLGDHVLELAGLRRKMGSRPRSGRKPTSQATLVAGAGFRFWSTGVEADHSDIRGSRPHGRNPSLPLD
jgi:hypothetical protein